MMLDANEAGNTPGAEARRTTLSAFLRHCAATVVDDGVEFEIPPEDPVQVRETFVEGGMAALRAAGPPPPWLQYNLGLSGATPELYRVLASVSDDLLACGTAEDVFFMHKPPGMRFRCAPAAGRRHEVDVRCRRLCADLVARRLIDHWTPAVYEPEQRLFGGSVSMQSVHRLFTVDSRVWLNFFAAAPPQGPDTTTHWALSLLMIRGLLHSLRIMGWEDVDVWDRIGRDGGRVLTPEVAEAAASRRLARALRSGWTNPSELRGSLAPETAALLERYEQALPAIGERWREEYFHRPAVRVGPRRAAAYAVIFHWNRARFPVHHQALVTHFLAARQEES